MIKMKNLHGRELKRILPETKVSRNLAARYRRNKNTNRIYSALSISHGDHLHETVASQNCFSSCISYTCLTLYGRYIKRAARGPYAATSATKYNHQTFRLNLKTYVTPWSRVLPKKLCPEPLIKFPAFYGTMRFITAFTTASHLSLSSARSISLCPHPTKTPYAPVLSPHMCYMSCPSQSS